ncbi:ABC transporter substrate-binding protein [Neorhizobium lilium]|uniref:ABC transporter substrate-binding protein n=1 Tax=Neorhizobium lilium TaxID=2503024 RepID=A0A444LAW8_9HYPH|nr:ABC transporter substrate-binding protein [Neorhizobium lilium]RWX74793.1 ABC transporter substrate-binding protein [Neorhizobium lilium]
MSNTLFRLSRRSMLAGIASASVLAHAGMAWAQAAPVKGGTMTILPGWEPPMLVSLASASSLPLSPKVTEGLLEFDRDLKPRAQLATEWLVSDDALTYTFKLRRGVKWHDGKDFTAADVAYSLQTLKTIHPRGRSTFAHVVAIETPDDHTVIIKLDKPTLFMLTALSAAESPIVPKHIYDGSDPATNPANMAPIGTGPFIFKEWVRGSHVAYERNPNYWDAGKPYLDRLIARFIPDQAARSVGFETGELDAGFRTPVALNDVDRLSQLANVAFESGGYEYSPPNNMCLEFNLDRPTFAIDKVRQAIAHAMDRPAMCKIVFFGKAVPSASPVVPGLKAFHNPMPSPYPFNLEKAKALLDEAGFPLKNGKRFSVTLDHQTDDVVKRLGEFIRATLSRIGVEVTLRGSDLGAIAKRVYTDRDFDMQIASLSPLFDPQLGVQRTYWSKNFVKGVPYSNATHYANPEVDRLLEASTIEANQAKRVEMWMKIQELVMTDVPTINLVMPTWETIHSKRAMGLADTGSGFEGTFASAYVAA